MWFESVVLSDCALSLIFAFRRFSLRRNMFAMANETIHANELHIEMALGE